MFRLLSAAVLASSLVVAACGSGASGGACGPVRTETLDRRSLVHVLPGGVAPKYLTDPPTSGPHQPSPPVSGLVDHPIDRPVQVGILEAGQVLIQYRGLDDATRVRLSSLSGMRVVIAPNHDLPEGDAVVATAWLTKQQCRSVDLTSLRKFVADHQNKAPGSDG